MQFVFVTAISISTSETQGNLTRYQHHRKKNTQKVLLPVDQPLANLDLEKQDGKAIQRKAGAKHKIISRKRDENTIITCHTDKHKQLLLLKYTKKAVSQVPDNKNY